MGSCSCWFSSEANENLLSHGLFFFSFFFFQMQGLITKCLWGYLCSDENVRLYKFCLSKQSATQLTVTDTVRMPWTVTALCTLMV